MPNVGIVIIGRGNEQFALKSLKDGMVGIWKVGDPKSIMTILEFRTANKVWDTGMGAVGLYYENPLNEWYGNWADPVPVWKESITHPGLYWNTAGDPNFQKEYYKYEKIDGNHLMTPTGISMFEFL